MQSTKRLPLALLLALIVLPIAMLGCHGSSDDQGGTNTGGAVKGLGGRKDVVKDLSNANADDK